MKYAQAQKEVLAQLIKAPSVVINCITGDARVALCPDSGHGYIFPEDVNWIDLERIEKTVNLRALRLPIMSAENKLEPTEHLREKDGILAREFKKQWHAGGFESVYIQEKYLKNFDFPTLYQDINSPKSIIAITETVPIEGEVLVGFVLPVKFIEN